MIVKVLEQIAQIKDWHFEYGRKDYNNLYDEKDNKEFKLFLDPIQINIVYSDMGNIEKTKYIGFFMLLTKSDFDRIYHSQKQGNPQEGKYEKYIKRCTDESLSIVNDLTCLGLNIMQWNITEVINEFDTNLDGVIVNFIIEK